MLVVKPGRVLFELVMSMRQLPGEALRLAMHKLPIKCKFAVREDSVKEGMAPMKANELMKCRLQS